jgi:chromosome segregation ATPase
MAKRTTPTPKPDPEKLKALEVDIKSVRSELDSSRKELTSISKLLESTKKEADDFKKEADAASKEAERLKKEREDVARAAEKATREADSSAKKLEDAKKKLDESTRQLKEITAERDAAVKAREEFEKQISSTGGEAEQLRKELEQLRKRQQSDQVKELAARTELEDKLAEVRAELTSIQSAKTDSAKKHEKELESARGATKVAESERDSLAVQLERQRVASEGLIEDLVAHRKSVPEIKKAGDDPRAIIASLAELVAELKKRLKDAAKVESELEKEREKSADAEETEGRLTELIAINRKLSEQLDAAKSDAASLTRAAKEAQSDAQNLIKKEVARFEKEVAALKKQISSQENEVSSLMEQLQTEGRTPYLSPEQVTKMIDSFYSQLSGNLLQMDIRESELKLKVGFGGISDKKAGVVIPTAENVKDIGAGLSEIVIRLGKLDR